VPAIIDWLLENWECYVGVSFLFRNDPTKNAEDVNVATTAAKPLQGIAELCRKKNSHLDLQFTICKSLLSSKYTSQIWKNLQEESITFMVHPSIPAAYKSLQEQCLQLLIARNCLSLMAYDKKIKVLCFLFNKNEPLFILALENDNLENRKLISLFSKDISLKNSEPLLRLVHSAFIRGNRTDLEMYAHCIVPVLNEFLSKFWLLIKADISSGFLKLFPELQLRAYIAGNIFLKLYDLFNEESKTDKRNEYLLLMSQLPQDIFTHIGGFSDGLSKETLLSFVMQLILTKDPVLVAKAIEWTSCLSTRYRELWFHSISLLDSQLDQNPEYWQIIVANVEKILIYCSTEQILKLVPSIWDYYLNLPEQDKKLLSPLQTAELKILAMKAGIDCSDWQLSLHKIKSVANNFFRYGQKKVDEFFQWQEMSSTAKKITRFAIGAIVSQVVERLAGLPYFNDMIPYISTPDVASVSLLSYIDLCFPEMASDAYGKSFIAGIIHNRVFSKAIAGTQAAKLIPVMMPDESAADFKIYKKLFEKIDFKRAVYKIPLGIVAGSCAAAVSEKIAQFFFNNPAIVSLIASSATAYFTSSRADHSSFYNVE